MESSSSLKFEIILPYYKRPKIVRNALDSIKNMYYDNWHLSFIDDSGDDSFSEVVLGYGFNEKVSYIPIMEDEHTKNKNGGSAHGAIINRCIKETDADVIVILCDDDALTPEYLLLLNEYYKENTEHNWSYCYVAEYDPSKERYDRALEIPQRQANIYNQATTPIAPSCVVDASQVTFRTRMFTEKNVWFPNRQTRNLDATIYNNMFNAWGHCYPNKIVGQVKAIFEDQLSRRHGKSGYEIKIE